MAQSRLRLDRTDGDGPQSEQLPFRLGTYVFKIANEPDEFEQIYELNYRTFVLELHQHDAEGNRLVDKFDEKNIYFVAKRGHKVVGMVCVHDRPPFSVESRLPDPRILYRPGLKPLEARLLAVDPEERRGGLVFSGLVWAVYVYARREGYTNLFISGLAERQRLYERLGFRPLGPAVPEGDVSFVPMMINLLDLPERILRDIALWRAKLDGANRKDAAPLVNLLPGPPALSESVLRAYQSAQGYHRSPEFIEAFEETRRLLCDLTRADYAALLVGSGTAANEAIAAALGALPAIGRGLILSNGEFGDRITEQATRAGLEFDVLRWEWGRPWDIGEILDHLVAHPSVGWVWGVHLETSTGVLNPVEVLVSELGETDIRVCLDCVSALGAVPLDLRGVYLASGVSGKSLGAVPGIAMVFVSERARQELAAASMPWYFDLVAHIDTVGPRFTVPAGLIHALRAAIEQYVPPERAAARYEVYATLGRYARARFEELGIRVLASPEHSSPNVFTFPVPEGETSETFVRRCKRWGVNVAGLSNYLSSRNLAQIAIMGAVTEDDLRRFFEQLGCWLGKAPLPVAGRTS